MGRSSVIREYVDDYVRYYPEKWRWKLKYSPDQNALYLRTRARRSKSYYKNEDLLPDFYSIERDADQFDLCDVEWTDFFGLVWKGEKGVHAYAGAPDYKGSLYYYNYDEEYDENYLVSEEYDAYDHQPPADTYTRVPQGGVNHWIDTVHVVDVRYKYVVENHLFKDTHIDLIYEDDEVITVYSEYSDLIDGLLKHGKKDLADKIFKTMNEHFGKLRDSDREEEREYYPGKTAEEMFLRGEENEDSGNP